MPRARKTKVAVDKPVVESVPEQNDEPAVEQVEEPKPAPKPAPKKAYVPEPEEVEVTYNGLKSGKRPPAYVTVTVPKDLSVDPSDPNAVISEGQTVSLAIGQSTSVSSEAADWLKKHYWYDFS